jgi:5'-3' exonuclease
MGVNGLPSIAKRTAFPVDKKDFAGFAIAVDIMIIIYKQLSTMASHGTIILDRDEDSYTVVYRYFYDKVDQICDNILADFKNIGCIPIFVFDNYHRDEKSMTIQKRKQTYPQMPYGIVRNLIRYGVVEMAIKKGIITDIKLTLERRGAICLRAKYDGEQYCAQLVKSGIAFATLSEDSDCIPFGSRFVIMNNFSTMISLPHFLEEHNITYNQLIDCCIIAGCDFNKTDNSYGIRGVAFATALKMIRDDVTNREGFVRCKEGKWKDKLAPYNDFDHFAQELALDTCRKIFLEDDLTAVEIYDIWRMIVRCAKQWNVKLLKKCKSTQIYPSSTGDRWWHMWF